MGHKLIVNQFKLKGVKVIKNKTHLVKSPEKRANSKRHLILIFPQLFKFIFATHQKLKLFFTHISSTGKAENVLPSPFVFGT